MKDCTCSNFSINTFLHLNNDHLLSQIDMFEKGGKIIIFHKSLHVQKLCKISKAFLSIFKRGINFYSQNFSYLKLPGICLTNIGSQFEIIALPLKMHIVDGNNSDYIGQ